MGARSNRRSAARTEIQREPLGLELADVEDVVDDLKEVLPRVNNRSQVAHQVVGRKVRDPVVSHGEGAALASAVVADLEEGFFPLLENGGVGEPVPVVDRQLPGYPQLVYSATATVNPDRLDELFLADQPGAPTSALGALEYRVDVELRWKESGRRRGRGFSVLLLREVPFGARLRKQLVENQ